MEDRAALGFQEKKDLFPRVSLQDLEVPRPFRNDEIAVLKGKSQFRIRLFRVKDKFYGVHLVNHLFEAEGANILQRRIVEECILLDNEAHPHRPFPARLYRSTESDPRM